MLYTKNETGESPRDLFQPSSFDGRPSSLSSTEADTALPNTTVDDVVDQLLTMKKREEKGYLCTDYLHADKQPVAAGCPKSQKHNLYAEWRWEISKWIHGMKIAINSRISSDEMALYNEVVAISLSYFDRYLASTSGCGCSEDVALLAALTSFYLALKVHHTSVQVDAYDLAKLCGGGKFSAKDILDMESNILKALAYMMNPPTTTAFLSLLLELMPREVPNALKDKIAKQSRCFVEISAFFAHFVSYSNLSIAFASMLNVIEDFSRDQLFDSIEDLSRGQLLNVFKYSVNLHHGLTEVEDARNLLRRATECFADHISHK